MVLLKKEKEKQLNELTMIATGIRIFNKASRKRGEETDLRELSTLHQPIDIKSNVFTALKNPVCISLHALAP